MTTNPPDPVPADQLGHVHFIGIGGAGMSGIARIMLARGITGIARARAASTSGL
jgi:UDP-N-acetylmuramate-alanine ligase